MTYFELFNSLFDETTKDLTNILDTLKTESEKVKDDTKSSIEVFVDKMKNKYGTNEIPYTDQVSDKVLENINKFVDEYYNKVYKDKFSILDNKMIEEALKKNYREFLAYVFTQL